MTLPENLTGANYFSVEADAESQLLQSDRSHDTVVAQNPTSIPPTLLLTLAGPTILKNAGAAATTATVSRNGGTGASR